MAIFFLRALHPKQHPKDAAGFQDGFVYKIISKEDNSVMQVEWEVKEGGEEGKHVCRVIMDEDTESNSQRFRASRIEKGKNEGRSQLMSILQIDAETEYIWDYMPHVKQLTQTQSNRAWNRLWLTKKKKAGLYFIKATSDDLYITNMGKGKQVALLPLSPSHHWRQQWILDPTEIKE